MVKVEDIDCPKCEENFAHLGTLNRHIYIDKNCKKINYVLENINWKEIWLEICTKNS